MCTSSRLASIAVACMLALAGCGDPSVVPDGGAVPVDASETRDASETVDAGGASDDAGGASDDAGGASDAGADGGPTFCVPEAIEDCYDGPAGTQDVGACAAGTRTCDADGSAFGACIGQTTPIAEDCATVDDDDCDGEVNEGCACTPGATAACYSGPAGTMGVGQCTAGTQTCEADGSGFGVCTGEVPPLPETCSTPFDDDCDGMVNEGGAGCVCAPGSTTACYSGPAGTMGVGLCAAGARTCNALGTAYGACTGETVPASESCSTAGDDDCDGTSNEGCTVSYAASVQPILQSRCASCHTVGGSGGANLAASYSSTQLASYSCAGLTKGACMLVRIQNGSMPAGRGCTGNPVFDAANPSCVTAAEQSTIQAWITGGQLP